MVFTLKPNHKSYYNGPTSLAHMLRVLLQLTLCIWPKMQIPKQQTYPKLPLSMVNNADASDDSTSSKYPRYWYLPFWLGHCIQGLCSGPTKVDNLMKVVVLDFYFPPKRSCQIEFDPSVIGLGLLPNWNGTSTLWVTGHSCNGPTRVSSKLHQFICLGNSIFRNEIKNIFSSTQKEKENT